MNKAKSLILGLSLIAVAASPNEGEKLFKGNCAVCHSIGKGKLVGPDLKGINTRYDEAWLVKWIKSSQTMVKEGDKLAVQVYNDNAKVVMPDQALSDEDIRAILSFILEKEKLIASGPPKNTVAVNTSGSSTAVDASHSLINIFGFSGYVMLILIIVLLIVVWVMSMTIKKLSGEIKSKTS